MHNLKYTTDEHKHRIGKPKLGIVKTKLGIDKTKVRFDKTKDGIAKNELKMNNRCYISEFQINMFNNLNS